MSKVSIIKCNDYEEVKSRVKKAIEPLGGINAFIDEGDVVVFKPDLFTEAKKEERLTTDPLFIKAVIELAQAITPKIYLATIPVNGVSTETLSKTGVLKVLKETDTQLINLEEGNFFTDTIDSYKVLKSVKFAQILQRADAIINLPKLRTDEFTGLSLSIQNVLSLIHPKDVRSLYELTKEEFSQGLVDAYSVIEKEISLNILDAVVGAEGTSQTPIKANHILASKDGVALDVVASEMTKHDPFVIESIKDSYNRELGEGDMSKIEVVGDELQKSNFKKHSTYTSRKQVIKKKASEYLELNQSGKLQDIIDNKAENIYFLVSKTDKTQYLSESIKKAKDFGARTIGLYTNQGLFENVEQAREIINYGVDKIFFVIDLSKKNFKEKSYSKIQKTISHLINIDKTIIFEINFIINSTISNKELMDIINDMLEYRPNKINFVFLSNNKEKEFSEIFQFCLENGILFEIENPPDKIKLEYPDTINENLHPLKVKEYFDI